MTAHVTSEDTAAAGGLEEQLVAWRRHIHTHPELSYEEHETTGYVDDELRALGLEPVRFRLGTGLWCDVPPADDAGREDRVALRADIDALPMDEESGLDFASRNEGVAHTCGHDGHTAMLLGAAALLVENPPPRPVRLIFQPAEETMPGGAKECVEEGVVDDVDRILALHADPHRRVGEVGVTAGPVTYSNAKVRIRLDSEGGHTARPHETQDTVFSTAQLATGITSVLDRRRGGAQRDPGFRRAAGDTAQRGPRGVGHRRGHRARGRGGPGRAVRDPCRPRVHAGRAAGGQRRGVRGARHRGGAAGPGGRG